MGKIHLGYSAPCTTIMLLSNDQVILKINKSGRLIMVVTHPLKLFFISELIHR